MARAKFSQRDTKRVTDRIAVARKYYTQTFETKDKAHLNLYVGQHWKELGGAEALISPMMDNVTENHIGNDIDLKVAGLAAEPPVFRFKPRGISHFPYATRETLARVWEVYIPYVWREGDIHQQMKAALRDRYIFGRGWVAIDWKVETRKGYVEGGDRPEDLGGLLYDNPVVRRVPHNRLLLDPEVDTLSWEEASYISWEMVWSLDRIKRWAKADPRVNKSVANRLKGDASLDPNFIPDEIRDVKSEDFKRATIHRYHERERGLVVYVAKEEPEEPLLVIDPDEDQSYAFEGYPFEPLWGRPWPDKYDAIGHAEKLRSWQRLRNLTRSKMAQMIRTARHMIAYPETSDEDKIQALESNMDRILIPYDGSTGAYPREVNTTGFPPEFLQMEPIMQNTHTELSGITMLRRGMIEQGLDTATETQALVSQSGVGDRDEQAEWEGGNRRVCRKVKALLEQFGDAERMAAVSPDIAKGLEPAADEAGNPLVGVQRGQQFTWVNFTPNQVVDEAEIEVLAGSMGAKEEALERAQMQGAVRTLLEIANAAMLLEAAGVNPQELAKMMMESFGTNKINRIWQAVKPLPDGMVPANVRPKPQNEGQNIADMMKSIVQTVEPGQGSTAGGGA